MIFLLVAAALVAGAPLIAAILVSFAGIREDATKSLAGHPPGPLAAAARRLLQARLGGTGPLQRPRTTQRLRGRRQSRLPGRPSRTDPSPAPRSRADGEGATRSYDALSTPRG